MKQLDFMESAFPNRKKEKSVFFVKTQTCRKRTSFKIVSMSHLAVLNLRLVSWCPFQAVGCQSPRGYPEQGIYNTSHAPMVTAEVYEFILGQFGYLSSSCHGGNM